MLPYCSKMATKKCSKNIPKFFCEKCNYKCSKQSIFDRHILTAKHKMATFGNEMATFGNEKVSTFICEKCDKEYTDRSGLWKHKKKCNADIKNHNSPVGKQNISNIMSTDIVLQILHQNQEFKQLLVEQQEENHKLQTQLIEAVKINGNTITNNTVNHTTNNNNQKFNLNFFLNTTCKDAMNMSEFIENIEVNFKDIENIGKNGYVSGMTDMILSRIKELDVTKRPMHCTDLKRETMYIKDNDEWAKDTPENSKFHKMIDYVAKQNYAKMPLWRQRNPECLDSDHPKYDFCIKMMRNMLGDVGAEQIRLDNKVIKNLSKHIFIDKK